MPNLRPRNSPRRVSRRALLASSAALALAAPFYRLLEAPSRARAATTAKRIILWFSPNGTLHEHWRPIGSGASFSFSAGSILEPLAAHKSQLLVLDGLDFERARGGSHEGGMEHMLTGGGGPSVDQLIAQQLSALGPGAAPALGASTPFSSIELGVQTSAWGAGIQTRMSYNEAHEFVHPEDDPLAAYKRLFGAVAGTPSELDASLAAKRSVLDLVKGELSGLQRELGTLERKKLDAHLDALRSLERRLTPGGSAACGGVVAPMIADAKSNAAFADAGDAQMELLVSAAACDLARVLSLQWSHTVSPAIFSWAGVNEGHHELSHKDDANTAGIADFVTAERWIAGRFALFLDKLAATDDPTGGGSLLDTSTVVWTKELGDSRLHDFKSVPFVIAGGGNGYWKPGRYLDFGGTPHQKLLVSLCQSMGVEVDHFGVSDITGALTELQT